MTWHYKNEVYSIKEYFLRNMKVESLEDINDWFRKSKNHKYRIDGIKESCQLIHKFKDKQITICGDYDVDGVTATTILLLCLTWLGFEHVNYRIPKRFSEGFGINRAMIDEISSGLVITCDNGIAQPDVISYSKRKGLTVIVTDHHEPASIDGKKILPEADVVIDPNAIDDSADFNGYCGAGIAYKLACELLDYDILMCRKLMGLAAIGTVADVMELKEENYVIVRNGLKWVLNSSLTTTGLYALISSVGLTQHITAKDIGFKLGPVINAASRMNDDGAKEAVELLLYEGAFPNAIPMAERFVSYNEKRKLEKKDALTLARTIVDNNCLYGDVPLVIYLPFVNEGIIGIIAGVLCEEYKVPVICLTDADEDIYKGSARSCGNYNMKTELDKVADLLIKHGGHEGAAGLSLYRNNLDELTQRLHNNARSFVPDNTISVEYDLRISAKDIPDTIEELEKYEPWGNGNPAPVFCIDSFSVMPRYGDFKSLIGNDKSIVKMYSANSTAIGFDMTEEMKNVKQPKLLNLVGTLSDNYFNGKVEHVVEFTSFEEVSVSQKRTALAEKLSKMALMS